MTFTPEQAEEVVKEKLKMLDDIVIVDQPKQQVAAAAMIMECCIVLARDIVQRLYRVSPEKIAEVAQGIAFKMFEALMRPAPQPQQLVSIDPRHLRNIPKV